MLMAKGAVFSSISSQKNAAIVEVRAGIGIKTSTLRKRKSILPLRAWKYCGWIKSKG
jgi:hypothetical protein